MFQDLSFLKMAEREEDGIHPGLYTPFEFPSIRGGIKIAYQGYCYVKEKVLKMGTFLTNVIIQTGDVNED